MILVTQHVVTQNLTKLCIQIIAAKLKITPTNHMYGIYMYIYSSVIPYRLVRHFVMSHTLVTEQVHVI